MTRYKTFLGTALAILATAVVWRICAQTMDEGTQAASEDMSVEAAVSGALNEPAEAAPAVAPEAPVPDETVATSDAPAAEPSVEIKAEAQPEAVKALEAEVAEILGSGESAQPAVAVIAAEPAAGEVTEPAPAAAVKPASAAEELLQETATEGETVANAPEVTAPGTAANAPEANEAVTEEPEAMPRLQKEPVIEAQPDVIVMREGEEVRRKAYEQHAMEKMGQAEAALAEMKFTEARALFETAEKAFAEAGNRPQTKPARQRCKQGIRDSAYGRALLLVKEHDLGTAEQQCKEARELGHPEAAKLLEKIQAALKVPPKPPPKPAVRWKQEDYKAMQKTTQDRLREGREFFMAGEYDRAQGAFETVLKDEPHNTEAIRWREKVAQKKYVITTHEVQSTREDMMTQVRKTWNRRDYGVGEIADEVKAKGKDGRPGGVDETRQKVIEKMQKIIIPEVDFRQANINDVVAFLQESSVAFDTSAEARKGVNLILNLRPGASATTSSAPAEGEESGATGGFEVPQVTFKARDITLLDVLKTVTEVAGLKYRIEGTVVMVLPLNAAIGPILHRSYDVLPTVAERFITLGEEMGKGGGAGEVRELGTASIDADRTDWKEFFKNMGVEWPDTSSIKYLPSLSKIMVANTAENLAVFEERLQELNVVPSQIEIEARFVEVKQTDLSSLGFEYLLTDDWELAQKKDSAGLPWGERERVVVKQNSTVSAAGALAAAGTDSALPNTGFTAGNRFLTSPKTVIGGNAINDKILTMASVLTNPELTFVLHALAQKGNADLLSAPKVVTQSGMEATIKVVVEYIYPTEFEVVTTAVQGQNGQTLQAGGIVTPQSFETREVGVILTVLPTVTAEGQMINLTMAPEVVTEPTWKDYGSQQIAPDGTVTTFPMPQPFFPARSINTSIIIYNGATVVMGGMITELRSSVDDKVPFLGDIPVLGRLFQSKADNSEKRNLLIFVTARLVDPAGIPIGKPNKVMGAIAGAPVAAVESRP